MRRLFTSESVTEGHPDKVCDQISDAVLDAILEKDPMARVACETAVCTGMAMICGEITTEAYVDINRIARDTIREIGYNDAALGFAADSCAIIQSIDEQSPDIALGVDQALEAKKGEMDKVLATGAGDQGMMFGYACNETPSFMPLPIDLAHRLCKRLADVRKNGVLPYLRPDGKSQVTVAYEDGKPVHLDTIVLSTQHSEAVDLETIRRDLLQYVILPEAEGALYDENTKIFVNPTGRFVVGGPHGDAGLTGRKIIVDTYGGMGRHGGGAFSGKDPTKVDRSAAYAARWIAKNIVAAGLADCCEVQLAYAIGVAHPVSVYVDTKGTGKVSDDAIVQVILEKIDLRPEAIIQNLSLRRPIYKKTAAYGHFGREDADFTWEACNLVPLFKTLL